MIPVWNAIHQMSMGPNLMGHQVKCAVQIEISTTDRKRQLVEGIDGVRRVLHWKCPHVIHEQTVRRIRVQVNDRRKIGISEVPVAM